MVQNNQEYRLQYWATRSSIRSFARTAYSFACSLARGKVDDYMTISSMFFSVLDHSAVAVGSGMNQDSSAAPLRYAVGEVTKLVWLQVQLLLFSRFPYEREKKAQYSKIYFFLVKKKVVLNSKSRMKLSIAPFFKDLLA